MIRQTHNYLVGAMGGATLIAIAIAVFVMLVSTQVLRDWPIAALAGGNDEDAGVSNAQPAPPPTSAAQRGGATDGHRAAEDGAGTLKGAGGGTNGTQGLAASGGGGSNPGAGTTEPGAAGGGQTGGAGGSPQGSGAPSGGGASGSGGSAGGGGKASGDGSSSPSSQVASTVKDTVDQVDESVLGGTLGSSGVTEATGGVVEGIAGPESPVGKVVDEATGAVGGILGSGR